MEGEPSNRSGLIKNRKGRKRKEEYDKQNMTKEKYDKQTEHSILKVQSKTVLKYERSIEENCPKVNNTFLFRSQGFYKQ